MDMYTDVIDSVAITINGTEVKRSKAPKTVVSRYITQYMTIGVNIILTIICICRLWALLHLIVRSM